MLRRQDLFRLSVTRIKPTGWYLLKIQFAELLCFTAAWCVKTCGRNYSGVYTETKSHNNKQVVSDAVESCASETSLVLFIVPWSLSKSPGCKCFILPPASTFTEEAGFLFTCTKPKARSFFLKRTYQLDFWRSHHKLSAQSWKGF